MIGIQHMPLFITSGLLLNIMPGPDTLYIVGRSVSQGRKAGVLSVLGISSGCLVHTFAAAFGLSAILAASVQAFTVVKLLGAAYLVYLGLRMLFDKTSLDDSSTAAARTECVPNHLSCGPSRSQETAWTIYRQGMLTNVLNPKVALFFLAFLPQFVDPASHTKVLAFLFLGGVFIFNGTLWCLLVVWFADAMSRRLRQSAGINAVLKRATGALFVGLGFKLAGSK